MPYVVRALQQKEKELTAILDTLSGRDAAQLEGSLRIQTTRGRASYYWKKKGVPSNGEYIRSADFPIACALAQKSYDRNLRREVETQLQEIRRLLAAYCPTAVTACYDQLRQERKSLIAPVVEPIEQFEQKWIDAHPDQQNPYPIHTDFYTERGERVRSKSEMIIADKLNAFGIPYRYETPLPLPGIGIIYPDFTILNRRTRKTWIWEHEGRMDDSAYSSDAVIRLEHYEKNGFWPGRQLIFTCETKDHPLNVRLLPELIEKYLL